MSKLAETDLYAPVRAYLLEQGYDVQGEVAKCDVAAMRGGELVAVELKLRLNAEVIAQAAMRQEFADKVYVAVPAPKGLVAWRKRSRHLMYLVRRLELGLLLVSPRARTRPKVVVEQEPCFFDRVKSARLRGRAVREVERRTGHFNTGGSPGGRQVNASRETAVHIACCIERFGPLTVPQLRDLGCPKTTYAVIVRSPWIEGWFRRDREGRYALCEKGVAALQDYADVAAYFRTRLPETGT
jgi:hypothetical protein